MAPCGRAHVEIGKLVGRAGIKGTRVLESPSRGSPEPGTAGSSHSSWRCHQLAGSRIRPLRAELPGTADRPRTLGKVGSAGVARMTSSECVASSRSGGVMQWFDL